MIKRLINQRREPRIKRLINQRREPRIKRLINQRREPRIKRLLNQRRDLKGTLVPFVAFSAQGHIVVAPNDHLFRFS
jgi:hypothetical protein